MESSTISSFSGGASHCRGLLMRRTIIGDVEGSFVFCSSAKQRCGIFHFLKDVKLIYEMEFIIDIQILVACSR